MRVIAGQMRGRRLVAPKGTGTRPTRDRVREALFSSLSSLVGPELGAGSVLDAFAGSGALGIEALSRGSSTATFIERDKTALAALRTNISALGLDGRARVITGNAFSLAERPVAGGPFALILLDPPYTLDPTEVGRLVIGLAESGSIRPGAVVTWEHGSEVQPAWPQDFSLHARKRYGSTEVDIAVYEKGADPR